MTHAFILKTFIAYLFIKAMIFLPLAWASAVFWWNDRKGSESEVEPSLGGVALGATE